MRRLTLRLVLLDLTDFKNRFSCLSTPKYSCKCAKDCVFEMSRPFIVAFPAYRVPFPCRVQAPNVDVGAEVQVRYRGKWTNAVVMEQHLKNTDRVKVRIHKPYRVLQRQRSELTVMSTSSTGEQLIVEPPRTTGRNGHPPPAGSPPGGHWKRVSIYFQT